MIEKFDHPLVFWLTVTVLVLAGMWLLTLGARAAGWESGAAFFAGPKAG
jgi:hypothetical protein